MGEKNNHIGKTSLIIIMIFIFVLLARMTVIRTSGNINHNKYSDPIVSSMLIRGTIYDRNGKLLSYQAPDYGFKIKLTQSSPAYIASIISPYVSINSIDIENLIKRNVSFFPLSYIPTKDQSDYLKRMISAFSLDDEITLLLKEQRKYPENFNIDNFIGKVDGQLNGISGIEKLYNDDLKAVPKLGSSTVRGASLVLTIDYEIQKKLEEMLPKISEYQECKIVILSQDNEILAYHGKGDDEELSSLVYSITKDNATNVLNNPNPFIDKELNTIKDYKIYIESEKEEVKRNILSEIETSL